ncbi:hypothetical protein LINPERPRIM_LOCUS12339 [Linum perenne]
MEVRLQSTRGQTYHQPHAAYSLRKKLMNRMITIGDI